MTDAKNMALLACEALEDKKASDIKVIDIEQITTLADYFIIASGSNRNQVQAMADNVDEVLGKAGYPCKQTEGYSSANWILLDYGDIVIHLFDEEEKYMIIMQDNGSGCKEIHYGYGLKQMHERVAILNGTIHFYSVEGFRTVVEIPKIGGKKDD